MPKPIIPRTQSPCQRSKCRHRRPEIIGLRFVLMNYNIRAPGFFIFRSSDYSNPGLISSAKTLSVFRMPLKSPASIYRIRCVTPASPYSRIPLAIFSLPPRSVSSSLNSLSSFISRFLLRDITNCFNVCSNIITFGAVSPGKSSCKNSVFVGDAD